MTSVDQLPRPSGAAIFGAGKPSSLQKSRRSMEAVSFAHRLTGQSVLEPSVGVKIRSLLAMQQAPLRLSQTLWSAFRAAKPVHRSLTWPRPFPPVMRPSAQPWTRQRPRIAVQARFYSEKKPEIGREIEDAKSRIDKGLESRADTAAHMQDKHKHPQEETIVHTIPESASIVHTSKHEAHTAPDKPEPEPAQPSSSSETLPSAISSRYSDLQQRFAHFMDNFQTHVFTASRRLNDLTGYSGIEALKTDIEHQESVVQECRAAVKDARAHYSEAIAKRSTTQREVNDLLHRKHTWSPADLERFTSLYRSDHANEQAETAAQKEVSDAEARYEEASTKLAKAILARYHEEQIWSDKIRQMSTWGTWGLMGINVLLFLIFQVVLEPWRRKRLVKGFEEKVELALKEREEETKTAALRPNQSTAEAAASLTPGEKVEAGADNIAEQIVDAVTGATSEEKALTPPPLSNIEAVAESLTAQELAAEGTLHAVSPDTLPLAVPTEEKSPQPVNGSSRWTSPESPLAWYEDSLRALFSDDHKILVSQRELTTVAMEGMAGGMAIMGLLFVLLRPR
ncbi:uncharacterized protein Z519_11570 [Cladophialophora bantiana CBS 173.52]|uniref:Sensitive to high expression protein 9, mitochondrial n=1 Tax=Cladophialophora bantiana (strain ATCC 10958 / CBS 173.52 / CDC B-1940 / NIH 8579) TaxID=1442370 RepID=A0A0D2HAQ5_CLAB1|nr:uncharacterized protein Z519_11570 [Cladophialophora bantiana CBS 173.52]KIW87985.1 hypothetical protein Z519_11570 [Cladophialophora bantiana CBS 173.52]